MQRDWFNTGTYLQTNAFTKLKKKAVQALMHWITLLMEECLQLVAPTLMSTCMMNLPDKRSHQCIQVLTYQAIRIEFSQWNSIRKTRTFWSVVAGTAHSKSTMCGSPKWYAPFSGPHWAVTPWTFMETWSSLEAIDRKMSCRYSHYQSTNLCRLSISMSQRKI